MRARPRLHCLQISVGAEYGSQSTNVYTLAVTKVGCCAMLRTRLVDACSLLAFAAQVVVRHRRLCSTRLTPATSCINVSIPFCPIDCSQPKPWGAALLADVRLHQLGHNYGQWSSYAELLRGGSVTLTRQASGVALCMFKQHALPSEPRCGQPMASQPCLPSLLLPFAVRTPGMLFRMSWAGGG